LIGASASSRKLTMPHCSTPGSCTPRRIAARAHAAAAHQAGHSLVTASSAADVSDIMFFWKRGRAAVAFAAPKRIGSHRGVGRTAERVYRPFLARCC
jgi:hypothetical protein